MAVMDAFPLRLPDLPERVDRGHVRQLTRGASTVTEVLQRALRDMQLEDEAEAYRDPIAYIGAHRRHRLIDRLLERLRP